MDLFETYKKNAKDKMRLMTTTKQEGWNDFCALWILIKKNQYLAKLLVFKLLNRNCEIKKDC